MQTLRHFVNFNDHGHMKLTNPARLYQIRKWYAIIYLYLTNKHIHYFLSKYNLPLQFFLNNSELSF